MSIGADDGQFEAYGAQLDSLVKAFDASAELRDLWLNPAHTREVRLSTIDNLAGPLGLSQIVANLVRILVDRQRLGAVPEIARVYADLVNEKVGRLRAIVTSAVPLSEEDTGHLGRALAGRTQKTVVLETRVDPGLLGGVITQVGGTVLDGSLKTQLDLLRSTLRSTRV
jgi:F-type H+-transporting ATPase subunit delta